MDELILTYNYNNNNSIIVLQILFDQNFTFPDEKKQTGINIHLPPVVASLCLLVKLRHRTRYPVDCCKFIDHPLINEKMESELRSKYEELMVIVK